MLTFSNENELVRYITSLKDINQFYHLAIWKQLRVKLIQQAHNECENCRQRGKITTRSRNHGLELHHHFPLKEYPQYALSEYVIDEDGNKVKNLVVLCAGCHLEQHPEKRQKSSIACKSEKQRKLEKDIPERW